MLTPTAKLEQERKKIETGVRICEEAIAKAEKYERLNENADWRGFLNDLKVLGELHDREIKMGESMLLDAPHTGYVKMEFDKQQYVSSRQDWVEFIVRHQIQKAECLKWIQEPEQIMSFAKMCRDKLPVLKKQLEAFEREPEPVGPSGNGKP